MSGKGNGNDTEKKTPTLRRGEKNDFNNTSPTDAYAAPAYNTIRYAFFLKKRKKQLAPQTKQLFFFEKRVHY